MLKVEENILLAPYTTFKIGGPARYFCTAHSVEELKNALAFAREKHLPVFILGGGSNILVADEGWGGMVIHPVLSAPLHLPIIQNERADEITLSVDAGMEWDAFVRYAVQCQYYGIENLSGIPGTVAGAVVANIGAYGSQVSDTLVRVEVVDKMSEDFTQKIFTNSECAFAYHESIFGKERGRYVITQATLILSKQSVSAGNYRDNRFTFGKKTLGGRSPTLSEVRENILSIREQKGALAMDGRQGFLCAGSFFHMPFVSKEEYAHVLRQAQVRDPEKEARLRPWAWEQSDGRYKLAPGFLLEYTEFEKGYRRGEVGISPMHTLSIINLGNGTARAVAQLASDMERAVEELFSVSLLREVEYIGNIT